MYQPYRNRFSTQAHKSTRIVYLPCSFLRANIFHWYGFQFQGNLYLRRLVGIFHYQIFKTCTVISRYVILFEKKIQTHSKYSVKKCRLQIDQVHGCELLPNILDMTWFIPPCSKSLHLASSSCGIFNLEYMLNDYNKGHLVNITI